MADILHFRTTYRNHAESDRWTELAEMQRDPKPDFKAAKSSDWLDGLLILGAIVLISYAAWVRV